MVADRTQLLHALASAYRGADWLAAALELPATCDSPAALKFAAAKALRAAPRERQLDLMRNHRYATGGEPFDTYEREFGWPFVLAPDSRGRPQSDEAACAVLQRRLQGHPQFEFAENLREVHRHAELALQRLPSSAPVRGERVWDLAELLARFSDPGYAERGELTVTYLTDAHRACAQQLADWMRKAGFDEVEIDTVGNVVGVYHGSDSEAQRLLTGSHYDTVRNAGRYDGRLGILVPLVCVEQLAAAGRRLPFGIEVVGFAEEEGQRYKATFLGSSALTGEFNPAWLAQRDADGISMAEAMRAAGLPGDMAAIGALRRDPCRYLGFVEVHIEQGPVLNELDLALGIVTSINGGRRFRCEVLGVASHAGTTPMDRRRDAAAAAAELLLHVEQRAAAMPEAVGTVGMLEVPSGSINVVPGRCLLSLDLRATTDAVRDALAEDVLAAAARICERRGLRWRCEETMSAAAAPSDPTWQGRWERAVASLGLPLHRMPSGAGHDAMKLARILPQAMLFVRGGNAGISHNPLESITGDDAELAVQAFSRLLDDLAADIASAETS